MFREFAYSASEIESDSSNRKLKRKYHGKSKLDITADEMKRKNSKFNKKKKITEVKNSVGFDPIISFETKVRPHTLILGTYPSIKSFGMKLTKKDIFLRAALVPKIMVIQEIVFLTSLDLL